MPWAVQPLIAQGPVTFWTESVICRSVSAMSPVLHTPIVGAATAGSERPGLSHTSGGMFARY
jgi:hypothetical protein